MLAWSTPLFRQVCLMEPVFMTWRNGRLSIPGRWDYWTLYLLSSNVYAKQSVWRAYWLARRHVWCRNPSRPQSAHTNGKPDKQYRTFYFGEGTKMPAYIRMDSYERGEDRTFRRMG